MKVIKKAIVVLLILIFSVLGLTACKKSNMGLKQYDSFEEFQAESNIDFYIPEAAEDVRMAIDNKGLSKTFLLSYVLSDDELEAITEIITQEKYSTSQEDGTVEVVPDKYYGVQVKEIDGIDENYTLDDFPHNLAFDTVIDDSVEDYIVIYYYPMNSGSTSKAVLFNPVTNRVLEFYKANIR